MTRFPLPWPALAAALLAAGCTGTVSGDDDSAAADDDSAAADDDTTATDDDGTPPGDDDAAPMRAAIVTTVAADYTQGSFASIDLGTREVTDEIAPTSPDPSVQELDGLVAIVNGYGTDTLVLYTHNDLSAPRLEVSTGANTNPREIASCGDLYWVTLYETNSLLLLQPGSGGPAGTVDLSPWSDADGLPEPYSAIAVDDTLYVSLQRLERAGYVWTPAADGGRVLEIDCATKEVTGEWTTGPSPVLERDPRDPTKLLVIDGVWYDESFQILLDGGVRTLDPATDTLSGYLFAEADLGGNVSSVAFDPDGKGLLLVGTDTGYDVVCADLGAGTHSLIQSTTSFLIDAEANDRGEIWVLDRTSWLDPYAQAGIQRFQQSTCTEFTDEGWIMTSLEPYSIMFY